MTISDELIRHYPWLPSLKTYYSNVASKDPSEFVVDAFSKGSNGEIQDRVLNLFRAAFENSESVSDYKADDLNVYLYLLLKILLYILNNNSLSNRIANLYSKIAYGEMVEESDAHLFSIFLDLNLKVNYYDIPIKYGINITKDEHETLETRFTIYYTDFLHLASSLRDDYRKLINNFLSEGYIFIQKRSLVRLIQEYVRKKILEIKSDDNSSEDRFRKKLIEIKELKEIVERIQNEWDLKKEKFEYSVEIGFKDGTDLSKNFPPCIKEILTRAKEGQNLIHLERLFLVFFLHALKYPNDKIVNVFSTLPDFNREKTEYQVNFAKKKGYTPHSCSTLKSLGLCTGVKYKDEICVDGYYSKKLEVQKKLTHPLFYVQLKQYRLSAKKESVGKNIKTKTQGKE